MPSPPSTSQPAPASENRYKQLFRKYGKVALGVHLGVYACFFAGCYLAVDNSVDVRGMLSKYGLMSEKNYDETADSDPSQRTWLERALTGSSSSLALAFICNKALFPLRAPITVALTPAVARVIRGRLSKPQKP